ncbi:MAG: ribonuclease III [Ruminococcaceae bacterium]|nr:ribonuclease III [Oscillospiraceae bacterium]
MNNEGQKKIAPSSAALAYLGDAVWEVLVRRMLVEKGVSRPSEEALAYVTAPAQSAAAERILEHLTEEESDVFRRARNNVHANVPRHATPAEYRRATGLEAVFGYLDWAGMEERKTELFRLALGDAE